MGQNSKVGSSADKQKVDECNITADLPSHSDSQEGLLEVLGINTVEKIESSCPTDKSCIQNSTKVQVTQQADECNSAKNHQNSNELLETKNFTDNKRKFASASTAICRKRRKEDHAESESEIALRKALEMMCDEEVLASIKSCLSVEHDMCSMYVPPTQEVEGVKKILTGFSFIVTGLQNIEGIDATWAKKMIIMYGGVVTNYRQTRRGTIRRNIARGKSVNVSQTILISEKSQRNYKYIRALAQAVPCVHYLWLTRSISKNEFQELEKYLLPAGYNLEQELIPTPLWMALENIDDIEDIEKFPFGKVDSNGVFDSYRIEIVGSSKFRTQIGSILRVAGAIVVNRLGLENSHRIDYIVSDSVPSEFAIWESQKRGLHMLNKEWVIQTIIQRRIQNSELKDFHITPIN